MAVLGHYVEHVKKLHPDAPTPGVYLAAKLFHDAQTMRETLGDEKFLRGRRDHIRRAAPGSSRTAACRAELDGHADRLGRSHRLRRAGAGGGRSRWLGSGQPLHYALC